MTDVTSVPLHQQPLDQVVGSVSLETSSQAGSIGSVMDGALSSDGAVPVMHDEDETTRSQIKQRGRPSKGDDSVQSLNCRWEGCSESFPSAKEARAHERVHGNGPDINGLFICKMNGCGRDFRASRQLRKHLILHQPKAMVCRVCNKAFHDVGKLARHEKVHTGAKPFSCAECGKEFGLRANLKTHMRVHSGERPFSCPVEGCDKRFAQACNRNTHLQTHYKKEAMEMQAGSAAASLMYMPLGSTSTNAIFPGFSNISAPSSSASSSNHSSNNNAVTSLSYTTSSSGGNHGSSGTTNTGGNQGTNSSSLFSGWTSGSVSFSVGTPQPSWIGHSSPHTWGGVSSSNNNATSTTSNSLATTSGTTNHNHANTSSSFFPADIVSWANFEQPISSSNSSSNANTTSAATTSTSMSTGHHHQQPQHHHHHRTGSNGVSSSSPMGLLDQNLNPSSFDLNTASLLGGGGSGSTNNNGKPVTHVEDASLLLYLQGRANN